MRIKKGVRIEKCIFFRYLFDNIYMQGIHILVRIEIYVKIYSYVLEGIYVYGWLFFKATNIWEESLVCEERQFLNMCCEVD